MYSNHTRSSRLTPPLPVSHFNYLLRLLSLRFTNYQLITNTGWTCHALICMHLFCCASHIRHNLTWSKVDSEDVFVHNNTVTTQEEETCEYLSTQGRRFVSFTYWSLSALSFSYHSPFFMYIYIYIFYFL